MRAISLFLIAIAVFIGLAALSNASQEKSLKLPQRIAPLSSIKSSMTKQWKKNFDGLIPKKNNLVKKAKKTSFLKKRKNQSNKKQSTPTENSLADSSFLTPGKYTCLSIGAQNDVECTQRCVNQWKGQNVHVRYWFAAYSDPPTCSICLKRVCSCCALPI